MAEPVLVADIIRGKRGLGADYRFEENCLEVKKNTLGIRGVFTRFSISEGSEVISVPVRNGSLTRIRAYEEALPLLQKLGADRYNLSDFFVIASALYLRISRQDGHSDLLIVDSDIDSVYDGSPMTTYGSCARAELLYSNHRTIIDEAKYMDDLIDRLNLESTLFRTLLAYCASRAWEHYGVIPVLDWLNSAYNFDANCRFHISDRRYVLSALRDIEAGEELTFDYNGACRRGTWLNYGFIDPVRRNHALLYLRMSDDERLSFESFAREKIGVDDKADRLSSKIDQCVFTYELTLPGRAKNGEIVRRDLELCIQSFVEARFWFRVHLFCLENDNFIASFPDVSASEFEVDRSKFGSKFEVRVLEKMRSALSMGIEEEKSRVEEFSKSEIGAGVDMKPYLVMRSEAFYTWHESLLFIEEILRVESVKSRLEKLSESYNLKISNVTELVTLLQRGELVGGIVQDSLLKKYVRFFVDNE
ncbi:MAG: SET domain-containing protein-lysine N-methyltransferase [Pseudomonadota bacterium]